MTFKTYENYCTFQFRQIVLNLPFHSPSRVWSSEFLMASLIFNSFDQNRTLLFLTFTWSMNEIITEYYFNFRVDLLWISFHQSHMSFRYSFVSTIKVPFGRNTLILTRLVLGMLSRRSAHFLRIAFPSPVCYHCKMKPFKQYCRHNPHAYNIGDLTS